MSNKTNHPGNKTPENWLYRRQYVLGPQPLAEFGHWRRMLVGQSLHLSFHPHLNTASSRSAYGQIVLLGHLLDPETPCASDQEILDRLLAESNTFDAFERVSTALGGRWLMLVQIGSDVRLYPDACGNRPVFYVGSRADLGVWAATQPRLLVLLHGLKPDKQLSFEYLRTNPHNAWPGEITPYPDIRQLLPNHYLDLRSGEPRRFWPRGELPERDLESAAQLIVRKFHGLIDSASRRRRVVLPLSGGNDSRALLAAAGDLREKLSLVTMIYPGIRYSDIWLSRKIARRLGLVHRRIPVRAGSDAVRRVFRMNTADMFWDPGLMWVHTFQEFDNDYFVLNGDNAGILRAIHYRDGRINGPLTPVRLAEITSHSGNAVAIEAFRRWRQSLPPVSDTMLLDLVQWEIRAGNWVSLAETLLDTVCEPIAPFNCREVLEAGLGVSSVHRVHPAALFRRIYEIGAPEIADLPVNRFWAEELLDEAVKLIPWRIRDRLRRSKLKSAGFVLEDSLPPDVSRFTFPPERGYEF